MPSSAPFSKHSCGYDLSLQSMSPRLSRNRPQSDCPQLLAADRCAQNSMTCATRVPKFRLSVDLSDADRFPYGEKVDEAGHFVMVSIGQNTHM